FRMGEVYRYPRPALPDLPTVDGIPNFHHIVSAPGLASLQLEKGINSPSATRAVDGERLAAVLLQSSVHKHGSIENHWHDTLAPDVNTGLTNGNRTLLRQYELHTSPDLAKRERAAPMLLFRSIQ